MASEQPSEERFAQLERQQKALHDEVTEMKSLFSSKMEEMAQMIQQLTTQNVRGAGSRPANILVGAELNSPNGLSKGRRPSLPPCPTSPLPRSPGTPSRRGSFLRHQDSLTRSPSRDSLRLSYAPSSPSLQCHSPRSTYTIQPPPLELDDVDIQPNDTAEEVLQKYHVALDAIFTFYSSRSHRGVVTRVLSKGVFHQFVGDCLILDRLLPLTPALVFFHVAPTDAALAAESERQRMRSTAALGILSAPPEGIRSVDSPPSSPSMASRAGNPMMNRDQFNAAVIHMAEHLYGRAQDLSSGQRVQLMLLHDVFPHALRAPPVDREVPTEVIEVMKMHRRDLQNIFATFCARPSTKDIHYVPTMHVLEFMDFVRYYKLLPLLSASTFRDLYQRFALVPKRPRNANADPEPELNFHGFMNLLGKISSVIYSQGVYAPSNLSPREQIAKLLSKLLLLQVPKQVDIRGNKE